MKKKSMNYAPAETFSPTRGSLPTRSAENCPALMNAARPNQINLSESFIGLGIQKIKQVRTTLQN